MSVFKEDRDNLATLEVVDVKMDERITSPSLLRNILEKQLEDDKETAEYRANTQEMMDYFPPYDEDDLEEKGMSGRFNVNFGLAASIKNEALGPFLDIYNSPRNLAKIVLKSEVTDPAKEKWAEIMSDQWTKMIRAWDVSMANMIQLIDIFVTHGLAITWFDDKSTIDYNVGSLEDCKFDGEAIAVPSKVEIMTIRKRMSITDLYAKIENASDSEEYIDGWNKKKVVAIIEASRPKSFDETHDWNFERASRLIKSCRLSTSSVLPDVDLIWGAVKEIDGKISIYATTRGSQDPGLQDEEILKDKEEWVYKKRNAYTDANEMFQLFCFGVGNKNKIYTIRGLGYALFQPGLADNILRCKMMDSARHRASEQYQPESDIEDINDLQFIDLGHALIAPRGLKGVPQQNTQRLDEGIGFVLSENTKIINKHSSGLSNNSITENPNARRNELQVTAELEHFNKAQGFAISLFYGPYDRLIRELVRRSFTETQKNLLHAKMVTRMKEMCVERGVPKEMFNKIDYEATMATRLQGAGSKGSRLIAYQQLGELYNNMDPIGQEYYTHDFASEIKGAESADRYFGEPGETRFHVDIAIARSENNDLLEGVMIEPIPGENSMVHLDEHIPILTDSIEAVNQGGVDLAEWTMKYIPLFEHCSATLSVTKAHKSEVQKLNGHKQTLQQVGEAIENGLRHINKLRNKGDMSQGADPNANQMPQEGMPVEGQPVEGQQGAGQPVTPAQQDNDMKMQAVFLKAQAQIEANAAVTSAKIENQTRESIAKISLKDAEMAAQIKRKGIISKATGQS